MSKKVRVAQVGAGYGAEGTHLYKPAVAGGWSFKALSKSYSGLIACRRINDTICPKAATHIALKGSTLCGINTQKEPTGHRHYGLNFVGVDKPNKAGLCRKCRVKAENAPKVKVKARKVKAETPTPTPVEPEAETVAA